MNNINLSVGQKVNGYELTKYIGTDYFSIVWQARCPDKGDIALKFYKTERGEDDKGRFMRENECLHKLAGCSNVISPYSKMLKVNDTPCFALELADNNLRAFLQKNQQLPIKKKLLLFKEMCLGILAAHKKGIVHRDLHEENIFIKYDAGEPHAKVADFGRARDFSLESKTVSENPLGRIEISPPEVMFQVVNSESDIPEQALIDIYSLGINLRTMLVSHPINYQIYFIQCAENKKNYIHGSAASSTRRIKAYRNCINSFDEGWIEQTLHVKLDIDIGVNNDINGLIYKLTFRDYKRREKDLDAVIKRLDVIIGGIT